MYRRRGGAVEVLLGHPGGPFWARKDEGAWSIPKGQIDPGEEPLAAARREFHEETGFEVAGDLKPLGSAKQPGGKIIHVWAFEGDCDPSHLKSAAFTMEWPPHSGVQAAFPELDRCAWFSLAEATLRILPGQLVFLSELSALLVPSSPP